MSIIRSLFALSLLVLTISCGGSSDASNRPGGDHRGGSPRMGGSMGSGPQAASVPVQVQSVRRGLISQHLETNGTLEAENEVDLVARASGPITELVAEEGDTLSEGQLLARIDDREARNQVANATVVRDEAKLAYDRTKTTFDKGLVSQEAYDTALSGLQSSEVQLENAEIQLAYTEIRAPFESLVVTRHVKQAQYVSPGEPLFRVSDFTPLLCPIEVPEKDLSRLRKGQPAEIQVEAFPGEMFDAAVLRIRPTVDAATGTVTVTLAVNGRGLLRPGMFASVYLETDTHENALVIPRSALVLDSIGDTVFVRDGGVAERREVRLGFREEDIVEVLEGLEDGEELIVLGQDGLADGTPVSLLDSDGTAKDPAPGEMAPAEPDQDRRGGELAGGSGERKRRAPGEGPRGGPGRGFGPGPGIGPGGPPGGFDPDNLPPFVEERIRTATPEELERMRRRMKDFNGFSDEEIDDIFERVRGEENPS